MKKPRKRLNRIKIVLLEKEKSNIWLADQLNVSKTTVSKWCTNDNQPTLATLFKIADALSVKVSDLLVEG